MRHLNGNISSKDTNVSLMKDSTMIFVCLNSEEKKLTQLKIFSNLIKKSEMKSNKDSKLLLITKKYTGANSIKETKNKDD